LQIPQLQCIHPTATEFLRLKAVNLVHKNLQSPPPGQVIFQFQWRCNVQFCDANRCFALKFCQGSVLLNDSISLFMGAKHGCLSPWSLLIRLIPKDLRLCRPRCRDQHDSAMTVKTCWHSEPPHLASKQSSRKARRPKSQINRDVLYCFDVLCLVMHCVDQPSKQHGFL